MLNEFKTFIARGNVIDLAVGIILGGAFGKIVSSLVEDVIMPPIGLVLGRVDFSGLFVNLAGTDYPSLAAARAAGAPVIAYGLFLNAVISFLIVAYAVFLLVKAVNRIRRDPPPVEEAPPAPTREEELLTEIRDLLAHRPAGTAAGS
ncbi:MAG: large conductance mechanosensitive channel protein MscL [Armatimonadetes bacterium]|nr:large conductance mechanosensitive channel protein MscL [Armatimonadota bacterium]